MGTSFGRSQAWLFDDVALAHLEEGVILTAAAVQTFISSFCFMSRSVNCNNDDDSIKSEMEKKKIANCMMRGLV